MTISTLPVRYAAGDVTVRDAALAENLNLVYLVARQIMRGLSANADFDELVGAGTMGLMGALESFDGSRGLAFSTFAVPRIRGAILDELRRQDHLPRSIRRKTRAIAQAEEMLMCRLGRRPEHGELSEQLGISGPTLWRWRSELELTMPAPLDRLPGGHDQSTRATAATLGDNQEGADDRLSREQEFALLREAITGLPERERRVLSLYYFEELTMRNIAEIVGLTEGRISQIRTKALTRLRGTLAPLRATA